MDWTDQEAVRTPAQAADLSYRAKPYHGRGGPIPVCRQEGDWSSFDAAFHDATLRRASRGTRTSTHHTREGSATARTTRAGVGGSAPTTATSNQHADDNLEIRAGATADRVLLDRDRAVGVRLAGPDGAEDVHADQVVLCAGALGSPSIPMHSGIGPADVLQPLGIPVTAELPVGRGLQDHMGLSVLSR